MAHEKNDRPDGSKVSSKSNPKARQKPLDFEEVKIGHLVFSIYGDSLMLKMGEGEEMEWALLTPMDAAKLIAMLDKYVKVAKI